MNYCTMAFKNKLGISVAQWSRLSVVLVVAVQWCSFESEGVSQLVLA